MLTLAWSYLAHSGKGYKIDHVIHTPCVAVTEIEYLTRIGNCFLAGIQPNRRSRTMRRCGLRWE